MYLKASGKIELFRFIFKFGNSCKIVSPKNLKEEFKKYLTDILSAY